MHAYRSIYLALGMLLVTGSLFSMNNNPVAGGGVQIVQYRPTVKDRLLVVPSLALMGTVMATKACCDPYMCCSCWPKSSQEKCNWVDCLYTTFCCPCKLWALVQMQFLWR